MGGDDTDISADDTAVVITDPQNDFLSPEGVTWELVGESVKENRTVDNIEALLRSAKENGYGVFVSPHYYYPTDHGWAFGGTVEAMMHEINMFGRRGAVSLDGFEGSGADWPDARPLVSGATPHRKDPVLMKVIGRLAQTAAALWILNVWFNRFNKDTGYRGGDAKNMKEEFEEYGLSETTMYAVGAVKVSLAGLMLVGHVKPRVVRPASALLAMFMAGAITMHIKVGDPVKRYLPALSVFSLATISAILNGRPSADRDVTT